MTSKVVTSERTGLEYRAQDVIVVIKPNIAGIVTLRQKQLSKNINGKL